MEESMPSPVGRLRKLKITGLIGLGLMLLYALSAGPAVMLMQRRILPQEIVISLYLSPYSPLEFMTNVIPGGSWLLTRYIALWEVDDHTVNAMNDPF